MWILDGFVVDSERTRKKHKKSKKVKVNGGVNNNGSVTDENMKVHPLQVAVVFNNIPQGTTRTVDLGCSCDEDAFRWTLNSLNWRFNED